MQSERTFIDDLKYQFRHGGMTMKLLFINIAVFLVLGIIRVVIDLQNPDITASGHDVLYPIVGLFPGIDDFVRHPWGLITYMFVHFDFLHLLMNMLFLFYSAKLFEQFFGANKLLYVYILGGLLGGILEILAHAIFPRYLEMQTSVVGASGSVMSIFVALAFYRPNLQASFFGFFSFRIIWMALAFIILDLVSLGKMDGTAHFAHLGGAVIGMISAQNVSSPNNLMNMVQRFVNWIKNLFKPSQKVKLKKTGASSASRKTDEEYNMEAKTRQEQIDRILDKISKSGYESLTKKEKDFLFNQSNR